MLLLQFVLIPLCIGRV